MLMLRAILYRIMSMSRARATACLHHFECVIVTRIRNVYCDSTVARYSVRTVINELFDIVFD